VFRDGATIVFVEVRYRASSRFGDGLASVTVRKQRRLVNAAASWLKQNPGLSSLPCRFDVALVRCDRPTKKDRVSPSSQTVEPGLPIPIEGYHLTLQNYLESAFC